MSVTKSPAYLQYDLNKVRTIKVFVPVNIQTWDFWETNRTNKVCKCDPSIQLPDGNVKLRIWILVFGMNVFFKDTSHLDILIISGWGHIPVTEAKSYAKNIKLMLAS